MFIVPAIVDGGESRKRCTDGGERGMAAAVKRNSPTQHIPKGCNHDQVCMCMPRLVETIDLAPLQSLGRLGRSIYYKTIHSTALPSFCPGYNRHGPGGRGGEGGDNLRFFSYMNSLAVGMTEAKYRLIIFHHLQVRAAFVCKWMDVFASEQQPGVNCVNFVSCIFRILDGSVLPLTLYSNSCI